jgi:hypothetical protein
VILPRSVFPAQMGQMSACIAVLVIPYALGHAFKAVRVTRVHKALNGISL